ncbi:tudor domain-containing protein 7B-like [Xyrichtys novacula]|uniref:Tudor domain-containing protein 7B-like n=1 Tax=Xyrichtys novacula TaxID=13765 RepID=A0AAV1EV94_XYRNO|nr:tudor domain-containing protein 7B-like [Xyrichtys novacula]
MSDSESVKKMLRSVLQSNKQGVSVNRLPLEFYSLCGEKIPLKKLGFSTLEDFLRSIPSVVRLEYRAGEMRCYASVCKETAHIAELVARQRSPKKSGRSHLVKCKMKYQPFNQYKLNARPRSSLRQPSSRGASNRSASHYQLHASSLSGDFSQCDVELVQSRMTQLLEKYCSGVWMSKLSGLYSEMFGQELHPQVLSNLEKWTHICMVEKSSNPLRVDHLIYPPLPPKPSTFFLHSTTTIPLTSSTNYSTVTKPISSSPSTPEQLSPAPHVSPIPRPRFQNPVAKPTFVFPSQPVAGSPATPPLVTLRSPAHNPALAPRLLPCASLAVNTATTTTATLNHNSNTPPIAQTWTCPPLSPNQIPGPDVLPLLKVTFSPSSDLTPCPPSQMSSPGLSPDVRQKLKELLSKYSHGVWAHGLPQLFMDTFKTPFPAHVLQNLSLLLDICDVEYPVPGDRTKAILYNSIQTEEDDKDKPGSQQDRSCILPSGLEVISPVVPSCLVPPVQQYPSVLVTDATSSNAVTIRYVGENYSDAQEAMEVTMHSFYTSTTQHPVNRPVVGQLVAVKGEDGEELARAQVMDVTDPSKIKVYYVDYGFYVETSQTNLLELHQDFLSLPFQATNVELAGLEVFSTHPQVLSCLDKLAVGKILLMETLEQSNKKETPMAVLYDTSQDEDVNINSACFKALQDMSMNNPLRVNVVYKDACVTNVCANGIIHCQFPCRGSARLEKLLERTEAILKSQTTSELLVSRPFHGKPCLARYKEKWSRAEITIMYGNGVMDILFTDLGVSATVKVTDLREIPPVVLKALIIIPPQVVKCRLAGFPVPNGDWKWEAIRWLREVTEDCDIRILKLDQQKENLLAYVYLFSGTESHEPDKSINHQLIHSELWQKYTTENTNTIPSSDSPPVLGLSDLLEGLTLSGVVQNQMVQAAAQPLSRTLDLSFPEPTTQTGMHPVSMPPPLELPQPGQNMDVFVPVACHPGYFVLQPWQDLHKLVVLMGEMILYYNQMWQSNTPVHIEKGEVYAAKVDKNWHRVLVKGILTNGLVSVYELDYGKHELVRNTLIQPLIEEFRQLPFQAITAQLAGLTQTRWSEEASMLFRNHVEHRALVAQVESVQDVSEVKGQLWERKLTVYLVDTTLEERDIWIHSVMADLSGELTRAA